MLFWILIAAIVIIPAIVGATTRHDWDRGENVSAAFGMTLIVSFFIFLFVSLFGASASGNVVTGEKTYHVAQSNVPTLDRGKLSFVYEENGTTKAFEGVVSSEKTLMEKPSKIKITDVDVVNPWIAPWPLNDRSVAEFIK